MNLKRIRLVLVFCVLVLFNVLLLESIQERILQINCFSYEVAYENLRNHQITEEVLAKFTEASDSDMTNFAELLTMYFATGNTVTDTDILENNIAFVKKYHYEDFCAIRQYVTALWSDLEVFPVGNVTFDAKAAVTFGDSWMQSRSFGGDRGHEGCDIMASVNQRGIYPIYSISDGVVENIGWLRLGGYRIGIRSPSGAYFYYAHLAEYAKDFQIGEAVDAGTFLGYMGDTGYSDVVGTTGNFDVHLHLGIYLNDNNGDEFSVNSYPMLRYLWKMKSE